MRALIEHYGSRLAAVIAVDGPSTEHITTQGIASRRIEVTITGPGGHSWSDFGAPNPITALVARHRAFLRDPAARYSAQLLQLWRDRRRAVRQFHSRARYGESRSSLGKRRPARPHGKRPARRHASSAPATKPLLPRSGKDAVQVSFRSHRHASRRRASRRFRAAAGHSRRRPLPRQPLAPRAQLHRRQCSSVARHSRRSHRRRRDRRRLPHPQRMVRSRRPRSWPQAPFPDGRRPSRPAAVTVGKRFCFLWERCFRARVAAASPFPWVAAQSGFRIHALISLLENDPLAPHGLPSIRTFRERLPPAESTPSTGRRPWQGSHSPAKWAGISVGPIPDFLR